MEAGLQRGGSVLAGFQRDAAAFLVGIGNPLEGEDLAADDPRMIATPLVPITCRAAAGRTLS